MKEHIYTIPVIDAFNEKGECPFCNMYKSLEDESVEYILGPAYMTDTIRLETDKIGFCKKHISQMYAQQNRLGVALMLHTHLKKINDDLKKEFADFLPKNSKKGFFKKNSETKNNISSYLNNITNSCYVCNRIDSTFERYIDTFFYMWKKKTEIKDYVKNSNGFCLEHFSLLLEVGQRELSVDEFSEFCDIVIPLQQANLERLEGEVEWFINKFDYKYKDEPWKTSKDALPRAITKINSVKITEEKDD